MPPWRGWRAGSASGWPRHRHSYACPWSSSPPVLFALIGLERGDGFQVTNRALGPVLTDHEDPAVQARDAPEQRPLRVLRRTLCLHRRRYLEQDLLDLGLRHA